MSDSKTTDTIAMHFRHSTTVDELVNKLRAHYVWHEEDDLPEWIAEPLKGFPLLTSYAQTLLQTLRSIPTSFGDQEATEYDLLVNCMITDQIMTSLREFKLRYRAAHPVPDSENKSSISNSLYTQWLFPAAEKKLPNSSNLKRSPLYRYLSNTQFIPCELDKEFMQIIALLHPYSIRNDAGKPVLRRACYMPLMYEHPYFIYVIEQNWGVYYDYMIDQHDAMQCVLRSLFESYADCKTFMEFQKEWFPFSHSRFKQTTADMHNLDLDCSELFDIVKYKKSYDTSLQSIDEVLRSDQNDYWTYFMKTKRYAILFSAMQFFFGYKSEKNADLPLQQLRSSICADQIDHNLEAILKKSTETNLEQYAATFGKLLKEVKTSRNYDSVYNYVNRLFANTKQTLLEDDDAPADREPVSIDQLVQQQKRMERNRSNSRYLGDCQFLSAIYASMIHAAYCLNPSKKSISACTVSDDSHEPLEFTESFESCTDYSISTLSLIEKYRFFIPPDYVSAPCTKMMFSYLYRIAKKNIIESDTLPDSDTSPQSETSFKSDASLASLDSQNCLGSYILAFIAENELQTVYAPDDKQIDNNHLWRWAHKLLHTSAVDQRESKTPVAFPMDFSTNDFPLLRDTMRWFWPLEQLAALIHANDMDFQPRPKCKTSVHCNLSSQEEREEIAKKGIAYWEQLQRGTSDGYKQFLKDNLHLPMRNP